MLKRRIWSSPAATARQCRTSRGFIRGLVPQREARINWASHVDFTYNLIRGCNPAPGA